MISYIKYPWGRPLFTSISLFNKANVDGRDTDQAASNREKLIYRFTVLYGSTTEINLKQISMECLLVHMKREDRLKFISDEMGFKAEAKRLELHVTNSMMRGSLKTLNLFLAYHFKDVLPPIDQLPFRCRIGEVGEYRTLWTTTIEDVLLPAMVSRSPPSAVPPPYLYNQLVHFVPGVNPHCCCYLFPTDRSENCGAVGPSFSSHNAHRRRLQCPPRSENCGAVGPSSSSQYHCRFGDVQFGDASATSSGDE